MALCPLSRQPEGEHADKRRGGGVQAEVQRVVGGREEVSLCGNETPGETREEESFSL